MTTLALAPTAPTQTDQTVALDPKLHVTVTVTEITFDDSATPVSKSADSEDEWDPSIPPVFRSADSEDEWDENDFSHEDLIRPPLRLFKKAAPAPPPSEQDLLYAREIQLQEEKAARRRVLKGSMGEREVEVVLEKEFGERERLLEGGLNALARRG